MRWLCYCSAHFIVMALTVWYAMVSNSSSVGVYVFISMMVSIGFGGMAIINCSSPYLYTTIAGVITALFAALELLPAAIENDGYGSISIILATIIFSALSVRIGFIDEEKMPGRNIHSWGKELRKVTSPLVEKSNANKANKNSKVDPILFDRKWSDSKKIDTFLDKFNNYKFFNENRETLFFNEDPLAELENAESSLRGAINLCRAIKGSEQEAETVIVSLLKANYQGLLQLQAIYNLPDSGKRLAENENESKTKALRLYEVITKDIDNFYYEMQAANDELEQHRLETLIQAKQEKKNEEDLLFKNSVDLLP